MANKTISDLLEKTTVADSDIIWVQNASTDNKVTKANLLKEVNDNLNLKANTTHTHTKSQITDFPLTVDNLISTSSSSNLSANQGKVLDDKITILNGKIGDSTSGLTKNVADNTANIAQNTSSLADITQKLGSGNLAIGNDVISAINSILIRVAELEDGISNIYGNIVVSKTVINVTEGGTASFTVKLDKAPSNNQDITISVDNTDVVLSKNSMTFTPQNYNIPQTINITISEDDSNFENEIAIITLSSARVETKTVQINITENDQMPLPKLMFIGDVSSMTDTVETTLNVTFLNGDNTVIFNDKKAIMTWQGSSSLQYPKKNYSIKLRENDGITKFYYKAFDDVESNHGYHLKANYIDATHSRNLVTSQLVKDCYKTPIPTNKRGVMEGFPIVIYINGEKQGVYTFNTKQDGKTVYGLDTNNPNHLMFRAENNQANYTTSFRGLCTSTIEGTSEWEERFPGTYTSENMTKLNRVIQWVMDCGNNDSKFISEVEQYFNKEYLIDYWIHSYFFAGIDSLAKNMCLTTYDGDVWYPMFYDVDSTWGINWQGTAAKLPTLKCPSEYECKDSLLWELVHKNLNDEILVRYQELRKDKLTVDGIMSYFNNFTSKIPQAEYDYDKQKWIGIPSSAYGLTYIQDWIEKRIIYVDTELSNIPTDLSPVTDGLLTSVDLRGLEGTPTVVNDISGNNNNLTLHNISMGFRNDGILFDGVDDYGSFNFNYGTKEVSVEVVFKKLESETKWGSLCCCVVEGNKDLGFNIASTPTAIEGVACSSGTMQTKFPAEPNKWYIATLNRNGSICKFYVNGNEYLSANVNTANYLDLPNTTTVGKVDNDIFKGVIASVRIFGRNLTPTEINQNKLYWESVLGLV